MFLGTRAYLLFSYIDTGIVNILSVYFVILPEALFVICKDPSYSDNPSISLSWYWLICYKLKSLE